MLRTDELSAAATAAVELGEPLYDYTVVHDTKNKKLGKKTDLNKEVRLVFTGVQEIRKPLY